MINIRHNQCLLCIVFVISYANHVQDLSCIVFVCPGFVISNVIYLGSFIAPSRAKQHQPQHWLALFKSYVSGLFCLGFFGVQCLSFQVMSLLMFVCVESDKVSSIHMKHYQCLICLEILCPMSRVCCVQCLSVQSLSCLLFICLGLVMFTVCQCRVYYNTF